MRAEGPASQWNCLSGVGRSCSRITPRAPTWACPRWRASRSSSCRRASIQDRMAAIFAIEIFPPVLGLEGRSPACGAYCQTWVSGPCGVSMRSRRIGPPWNLTKEVQARGPRADRPRTRWSAGNRPGARERQCRRTSRTGRRPSSAGPRPGRRRRPLRRAAGLLAVHVEPLPEVGRKRHPVGQLAGQSGQDPFSSGHAGISSRELR